MRRLLPSAVKQAVGPFIFFDHFGPIDVAPDANHDVRPHPHIGLATVTYLFEGAIDHRDSIGSYQRIEPGAINWMTAGRGIVHSERTPHDLAGQPHRTHGLQLWAALPKAHEEDEPSFTHTPQADIPVVPLDGAIVKVLIGTAFGKTSPVRTYMQTLYLDVALQAGQRAAPGGLAGGSGDLPDQRGRAGRWRGAAAAHHGLAGGGQAVPVVTAGSGPVQFVVIGGEPLDGHRFLFWNFVSSSKERLSQAADDWSAQRMGQVPGETEFIPLPKAPLRPSA